MDPKQTAIIALRGLRSLIERCEESQAQSDALYQRIALGSDEGLMTSVRRWLKDLDLYLTDSTRWCETGRAAPESDSWRPRCSLDEDIIAGLSRMVFLSDEGRSQIVFAPFETQKDKTLWLNQRSETPIPPAVWALMQVTEEVGGPSPQEVRARWDRITGRFPLTPPPAWPEPLRLLLLDVDGVLNNEHTSPNGVKPTHPGRHVPPDQIRGVDRQQMALLNRIIEATGALVVLSSSWRVSHGMEETRDTFDRAGFAGHILTGTPNMRHRRSGDIQMFLDDWDRDGLPKIASYVILDDEAVDHLTSRAIRTDTDEGLTEADVARVVALLGN